MKKAAALILILVSISLLQYYAFVKGSILTAIPDFFTVVSMVSRGTADFPIFIHAIGNALLSIGIIFLSFAVCWIGLELLVSKDRGFRIVLSRNPIVFLSVGSGIYFGAQFSHAFGYLLTINFAQALIESLFALAALEFTLTLLRYLKSETGHFEFTLKFKRL
ncbi:MAG: hypothetical protein ABIG96_05785 [Candidatus Micrarchaeota archaeon]